MKKADIFVIIILMMLAHALAIAQVNFVPVEDRVYVFLEKMTIRNLIAFRTFEKPISRMTVGGFLFEVRQQAGQLTRQEVQELEWYEREYASELKRLHPEDRNSASIPERWRLYAYSDSVFTLRLSPAAGVAATEEFHELHQNRWWGVNLFGNISGSLSFDFSFDDHLVLAKTQDRTFRFTNETEPLMLQQKADSYEYDETNGAFLYGNSFITAGIVKQPFELGSGYRSQLIMSTKAPSFPAIYLRLHPAKWIQFHYYHGWLLSRVHDSLASYDSQVPGMTRNIDRDKYIALHAIELLPLQNLDITLGESIIYSDKPPELGFLLPFVFYRSIDHMSEGTDGVNTGGNSQFFFDAKYDMIKRLRLYATIFLDEFSFTDFLRGNSDRNQSAYTIGVTAYDFGVKNLLARAEYTKIMPWVYSNFVQTQTYTNSHSIMGDYIGQNADRIYGELEYGIYANGYAKLWGEYIRRGGFDPVSEQYQRPGKPFLYGLRRTERNIGFEGGAELFHELHILLWCTFSDVSDEDATRTPAYELGMNSSFGVTVRYGL